MHENRRAPTPGGVRQLLSLDGAWHFVRDPERRLTAGELPDGEPITVPGCWEAQIADPFGIVHAWYWRDLDLPPTWSGEGDSVLRFGAVMYRCETWLNGRWMGVHEGGYSPFEIALPDLRLDGPNRLEVLVTNPVNALDAYPALSEERLDRAHARLPELPLREIPHGKQTWYASQSGLWRSVILERRSEQRIASLRAIADWASGNLEVRAHTVGAAGGHVELAVHGPDGAEVVATSVLASPDLSAAIEVPERMSWDLDAPVLYQLFARLHVDGRQVDEAVTRFGFREIRTEKGQVLLNGRPIFLRGALDQDLYADTISTPPDREFLDRQIQLAREMGLNLLRIHIKSPDPMYLDAADEAGMLLWCELPNWLILTPDAAARGERLLTEMVEVVGDHPSVVIWTIINEDWGTDLRHSAADRRWLRRMTQRLRSLDATRLVVDNSPCPALTGPNFHLDTDLADFHRYAAMPDAAPRWRAQMAELAERPAWLWSPHGDALRRGDEPVVVSEFGTWGLPDPAHVEESWWAHTGDGPARPAGVVERFAEQRLDRIWPDAASLSAGTRRLQVDALRYQVGEIRRHSCIAGLVVTEFTDAFWEANGLLDVERRPKPYHDRLAEFFGPAMLIVDLPRHDLWSGERIDAHVTLSASAAGSAGRLSWRLGTLAGSMEVGAWAGTTATRLATIELHVPEAETASDHELSVELVDHDGAVVATTALPLALIPIGARRAPPRRIWVTDPLTLWGLAECLGTEGHDLATNQADAHLLVATRLDAELLHAVEGGANLLLLARSDDALPPDLTLERPARLEPRWPDPSRRGADFTWTGDWISAFSWIIPSLSSSLPLRSPLDFTFAEVMPDHVLCGYEPAAHADEVMAGMFVGWVHSPVALAWSFPQGRGRLTITTLKVAPESGPVATALRGAFIDLASR